MKEGNIRTDYYKCDDALISSVNNTLHRLGLQSYFTKKPRETDRILFKLFQGELVNFKPTLTALLGFDHYRFGGEPAADKPVIFTAEHESDVRGPLHTIYLYSDIIKPIVVGDAYTPLLRTPPAREAKGSKMVHHDFLNPHYLALDTGNLSSIEIKLCDEKGDVLQFETNNAVIVKLHFKRD